MTKKPSKPTTTEKLFVGIDPSLTATGIALINRTYDRVITHLITSRPNTAIEDRILYIWTQIKVFLETYSRNLGPIAIEQIAFGSRGQKGSQLAGLHYFIRIELARLYPNKPMYVVSPSTLKTFVCGRGKGKAKKELMLMRCALKFKQEFEDNNICDAYCLARYAIKNSSKLRENWRENRKKV